MKGKFDDGEGVSVRNHYKFSLAVMLLCFEEWGRLSRIARYLT